MLPLINNNCRIELVMIQGKNILQRNISHSNKKIKISKMLNALQTNICSKKTTLWLLTECTT